jgi:hypothetical protein
MTLDQHRELAGQAAMATPSLGAIVVWLAGVPIEKWAAVAGLCFIVLQAAGYIWRLRRDMRREDERIRRGLPPPDSDRAPLQ